MITCKPITTFEQDSFCGVPWISGTAELLKDGKGLSIEFLCHMSGGVELSDSVKEDIADVFGADQSVAVMTVIEEQIVKQDLLDVYEEGVE